MAATPTTPVRLLLPLVMCGALLGAPLLLLRGSPAPRDTTVAAASDGGAVPRPVARIASRSAARHVITADELAIASAGGPPQTVTVDSSTTTTAAAPRIRSAVVRTTTPTTAPRASTASTARPTTTTTAPRPTTTTTAAPSNSQTGAASWYQAPAGYCAHPTLPFGTVVTVTNLANGASTTCTVEDRGPYEGGRIIDLAESTFSQIASPSQGVIQVRIQW